MWMRIDIFSPSRKTWHFPSVPTQDLQSDEQWNLHAQLWAMSSSQPSQQKQTERWEVCKSRAMGNSWRNQEYWAHRREDIDWQEKSSNTDGATHGRGSKPCLWANEDQRVEIKGKNILAWCEENPRSMRSCGKKWTHLWRSSLKINSLAKNTTHVCAEMN